MLAAEPRRFFSTSALTISAVKTLTMDLLTPSSSPETIPPILTGSTSVPQLCVPQLCVPQLCVPQILPRRLSRNTVSRAIHKAIVTRLRGVPWSGMGRRAILLGPALEGRRASHLVLFSLALGHETEGKA